MTSVHKKICLGKQHGSVRELAMMVMAKMRDNETKLIPQVKKLIKEQKSFAIQILSANIDGWTPIHACALRGSKKLLKVFLSSGIDINTPMGAPEGLPAGCTLLHMACLRGDLDLIEYLVSQKPNLDMVDSHNMTPVMYAAQRKHKRIVLYLQEKGANMSGVTFPEYECITPKCVSTKFCFF